MQIESTLRKLVLSACAMASLTLGGAASAATITASDFTEYVSAQNIGGVTFTSSPGVFVSKLVAGYLGVGVSGPGNVVSGEIDDVEAIDADFGGDVYVSEITLGFLFLTGNEGDATNEIARITYGFGEVFEYGDLQVTGATTASWSGPGGTVVNVSPALDGSAGVFRIVDPFGGRAVSALKLTAVIDALVPIDNTNADYALVSLSYRPVPEPGTALLAGIGLVGLAAAGRRRSA